MRLIQLAPKESDLAAPAAAAHAANAARAAKYQSREIFKSCYVRVHSLEISQQDQCSEDEAKRIRDMMSLLDSSSPSISLTVLLELESSSLSE
jgi:hypothetical protein